MSRDGAFVAGEVDSAAAVWDTANGWRRLLDIPGVSVRIPAGWTLGRLTAISDDGRIVVGNATNASGNPEGFVLDLTPAPVPGLTGLSLLLLGGVAGEIARRSIRRDT